MGCAASVRLCVLLRALFGVVQGVGDVDELALARRVAHLLLDAETASLTDLLSRSETCAAELAYICR